MTQAESPSLVRSSPAAAPHSPARRRSEYAALLVILLANVLLKSPNLGHPTLKPMDESFHAVVARNLLYDPFKPTLVREPYLDYNPTDWLSNHVWLHKPVLPLWIIAISFKLLGVNGLALRLPSLLLSTLSIAFTFLITRRLYGAVPGLIASAIQAIVPVIGMIVHGYVFSDAIDINLLFWCELSLLLMLNADRKWIWLSGAAAGAAFMSKTFPALFVLAPLMLVLVLRARAASDNDGPSQTHSSRPWKERVILPLLGWLIAFLLVVAPWNIYCSIRFPREFTAEYGLILTHLSSDVENWASPWDRLWFQHLPGAFYMFWTTSLVGSIVLTFRAIQLKKWDWLFVPVWIAAVLIPFTLATSKTPTATLIAWPALMIGAAFLIWRACQGYVVELSALLTLLIAAACFTGKFISMGWGQTGPFEIMRQANWISYHVAAGLCVACIALLKDIRLSSGRQWFAAIVVALLAFPTWRTVSLAARVANLPQAQDVESRMKGRIVKLPPNAVILVKRQDARLRNEMMFYLDRSSYVLPEDPKAAADMLRHIRRSGGDVWIYESDRAPGRDPLRHDVE